jgi:hypothetical protein
MLTVIVEARTDADRAPQLLAQLTAGAVEGLVREVVLIGPREGLVAALCEETGAEAAASFAAALQLTRQAWVLGAHAPFRFREGWIEAVQRFLQGSRKAALVRGQGASLLGGPYAVLVQRGRVDQAGDVRGLRRRLGLRPARIG